MNYENRFLRIAITAAMIFCVLPLFALGKRETKTVDVGETFTVYSSGHTRLQSVLWRWDTSALELVGQLYGTSTSATFKAKKATPSSGVVIQATVYYYASQGTIATGKFFDDWTIHVQDRSTVSLNTTRKTLPIGDFFTLKASTTPTSYAGSYSWTISNSSVATVSGLGNSVTVRARAAGRATVKVTLDNGKYAECDILVEDNSTVSLSETRVDLSTGGSFTLRANATSDYSGSYSWSSSNTSVVSCTGNGPSATLYARSAGYATVSVTIPNGASARCEVYVSDVAANRIEVSDMRVEVDKSSPATMTVYPKNATVKNTVWEITEGADVVSISSSGTVTGKKPGSARINCLVNGSVRSNSASVVVYEPDLTTTSSSPSENTGGVSVFVNPTVSFSHSIERGADFGEIRLSTGGESIKGTVRISGNKLTYVPEKALKPLSNYTLRIPRNAVINKWGSPAKEDVALSFTTADLEKASVEMSPVSGSCLLSNETVTLAPNPSDAAIYYTLDGSDPSRKSERYVQPISISGDITVKAIAVRDGWYDSDVVTGQYSRSQSEITGYYPNDATPLFNYGWAAPHIKLSGFVKKSNNFRRISLTDDAGNSIDGEPLLTGYMITFVPEAPLENGRKYTMDIPRDAVKTTNGEVFRGFNWTFTTPTLPSAVAMRGDETVFVLSEDGVLRWRGLEYQTLYRDKGSFTFEEHESLTEVQTGVDKISGGYTHLIYAKDASAKVRGFPLCGEWGTAESINAIGAVKSVKAGFQTTAIIGEDNSLWMCGRNDFYQLGDGTGTTQKVFVKVADNVTDVALGNCYSLYIDTDNVLWAVGRNHRGQLGDGTTIDRIEPVKVMEGVKAVYASACGFFSACITTDNQLMTWGDNEYGQLGRQTGKFAYHPGEVLRGVVSAALGEAHVLALTEECKLYAWGANADRQTADSGDNVTAPKLLAENVKAVDAGPHTSLILYNNGKVTGRGRKTHSNFGSGAGSTSGFTVAEGRACSSLSSVIIEPARFEAEPESRFALVAVPMPYTADYESVEWTSDRPEIARVDGNGAIQTGQLGEANITARFTDRFGVIKEAVATVICTEKPQNSGVEDVIADGSDWKVYAEENAIVIRNASVGKTYTVYNVQGLVVGNVRADTDCVIFNVNRPGVYIVCSGDKAVKVGCR